MSNDKNNLVYREQLDDNVIEMLSEDIGSNYSLRTENTKTIVAALNEILGKDIICNAVGSPLLTTDTFAQMGEKIHVMINDFKAKLLGLGVSVSSVDKMAVMIEKIGEINLGVDAEELMAPLEESLRGILGDEGVEISGEETLAELIIKVDEEFDKKNETTADRLKWYELLKSAGYNVNSNNTMDELYNALKETCNTIDDVKQIVCGDYHTVLLKNDDTVWTCGWNEYGQLGLGDTNNRTTFTETSMTDVKQVSCGEMHTVILKNDGSLWACGYHYHGQLGLGNKSINQHTFTQVTTNINNDVKQVACGSRFTYILKNDGSLWSCGWNRYGQLGLGAADEEYHKTFTKVTTNINNDVKQIACSNEGLFILKNDGSVWSCGYNGYGELGLGNTTNQSSFIQVTTNINNDVKEVVCGGGHSFIIKNDGSVWACGLNGVGQLGLGNITNKTTFTKVTALANNEVKHLDCGGNFTCIVKNDGSLWVCGDNEYGQLGIGTSDENAHSTFTKVTTNINNDVNQVVCGFGHTFILKNDGTVWSCGNNEESQLGLGDADNRVVFTYRTGFSL